jgi:hypothetical protein
MAVPCVHAGDFEFAAVGCFDFEGAAFADDVEIGGDETVG